MTQELKHEWEVYRHYKGEDYQLLREAHEADTGRVVVVYRAMYPPYTVWTRPRDEFFGTVEVDGQTVSRFQRMEDVRGAVRRAIERGWEAVEESAP